MSEVLCAVDPGPRPGLAMKIGDKIQTALMESPDALYRLIGELKPQRIAVEQFARSNVIDANMIRTMECVGGVEACAAMLGVPFHRQFPQQRISYLLDTAPYMLPGSATHEKDACAHLLLMIDKLKQGKYT